MVSLSLPFSLWLYTANASWLPPVSAIWERMPTKSPASLPLFRISTSLKQPFPVDFAYLTNVSQKNHPVPVSQRTSLPEDETATDWDWRSMGFGPDLGWADLFWSSPLVSWLLLKGYLWQQAWSAFSSPLSRGGPDVCGCVLLQLLRVYHVISMVVFVEEGGYFICFVWMGRMLLRSEADESEMVIWGEMGEG